MSGNRRLVTGLGVLAAIILFWMENPWFTPESISESARIAATVTFWVLFVAVIVLMFRDRKDPDATEVQVEGPAFTRYLFSNRAAGVFWLPIRLFLGFQWIESGWHKLTGGGWITDGGSALAGYWTNAVKVDPATAKAPISFEWYRDFVNVLLEGHHQTWFAWLIAFGETAVGIGLLVGALVGVAAFFGALMNMSFLLAGSASTNPVLFTMAIGLMLAWKVAGYYGLDRYLLPLLGTPWHGRAQAPPLERSPARR
ncbi:MAG: thiosulfate dehydrogenase (quinone) large subunit [Chloroflexota bacterium]|jgi:thiosulfate dehydrogenase [quinone] large subunit|nr:thiosulfate dehydrogenase (quinone) large subunit [Chloroflexota bacterium]